MQDLPYRMQGLSKRLKQLRDGTDFEPPEDSEEENADSMYIVTKKEKKELTKKIGPPLVKKIKLNIVNSELKDTIGKMMSSEDKKTNHVSKDELVPEKPKISRITIRRQPERKA